MRVLAVFRCWEQSRLLTALRLPSHAFRDPPRPGRGASSNKPSGFAPIRAGLLALITAFAATACDDVQSTTESAQASRPVNVFRLRKQDFARETRLTGSVGLYRQQKVGFEVEGRLLAVIDAGREVLGPSYDEQGRTVRRGDVIAKLDDTRYRLRVKAMDARLRSLNKELEAQEIDLDKVASANLHAATAALKVAETDVKVAAKRLDEVRIEEERANKELKRQQQLMRSAVGRRKGLDEAQAAFDSASARVDQYVAELQARKQALEGERAKVALAEASILLKRAQIEATKGKIAEHQETLNEAKQNLLDAVLRAPFSGRITAIHASQGAVVSEGSPVATLSLLDPIEVQVEVSADDDRRIRTGDKALLFPTDPIDPGGRRLTVDAVVFEKDAVANPKTRTFRIALMARNERRRVDHFVPETRGLPLVEDFLPVARRYKGETGPLFVPLDAIYEENGETFVLRLPGFGIQKQSGRGAVGKHIPEKVKISLGSEYLVVIKWRFRSINNNSELREGDFLVLNPRKEHLDGLAIGRPQWLFRPGELVPIRFTLNKTPRGFYVPATAITDLEGSTAIFSVKDGKAYPIRVRIHETYGEYRRIAADELIAGLPVITDGLHYLSEGQPVNVLSEERAGQ